MKDGTLQLALRDLRAQMRHPVAPVAVLGVAAVLAILGPFGTLDRLSLPLRALYWGVMVAGTYALGALAGGLLWPRVAPRLGMWPGVAVVGCATGLAILPYVVAVNLVTFGYWPEGREWLQLAGPILGIAVIVTAVLHSIGRHLSPEVAPGAAAPALLDRIALDKRGALVALSVEDHYVRVRTAKGEEMLLMRLTDAIRESAPVAGLRVHRSHWVALDQVRAAAREGDRALLTMSTGPAIPVSRANVPAIRDAGLLPK